MFPFREGYDFPRNQWYVAGWSNEVTDSGILERWILNEPVIFYRTVDGTAVALDGRCPHRNYPLGKSPLKNGKVECGYHGITFDHTGQCVHIPTQVEIPAVCSLRAYPLVEKWRWLWIWPGDPAKADPSLIPDHDEIRITSEGWLPLQAFTYEVQARAQLFNENLMDISHLTFLHAGTIGTAGVASTEVEVIDQGRYLRGTRRIRGDALTGFFSDVLKYHGDIDREVLIDFYPPGLHVAWEMFMPLGSLDAAEGSRPPSLGEYRVHHAVTPATHHKTNYFVAFSRTFARDEQSVTDTIAAVFTDVIAQDIDAIEAIEQMITQRDAAPREVLVRGDRHSIFGRRKLEGLFDAERASHT
ncbi:MAG: aromatic ring-hydroxylating dioxygenase subunit alpha [Gammaproteobacteria bacterium]|nr:aromatic ring-hydroxylating dioxygenase subunit alpha [Gammaproteobacteria bacterium]